MTDLTDRLTFTEKLAKAGNSADLTVRLDQWGDADALIAAGKASHQVGRYLDQLTSEWDVCTPPRRLTRADIEKLAEHLPRVLVPHKSGKPRLGLDLKAANAEAQAWCDGERRRIIGRLKSLPKLMDPHAGLIPWLVSRNVPDPDGVLLDVLGWYLDRRCPGCNGTKWEVVPGTSRHGNKACRVCHGHGDREIPHEPVGRQVVEFLVRSAEKSRNTAKQVMRNIRSLKYEAVGKKVC